MYCLLQIKARRGVPARSPREFAMVRVQPVLAAVAPPSGSPADVVAQLPEIGSPERWPWLQRLRRQAHLPLEPWLRAVEAGQLTPQPDLMAALDTHLDGPAMARLLRWWLHSVPRDPALPPLLVPRRGPEGLEVLRQACAARARATASDHECLVALLPLLGHQRDPEDFPLLRRLALEPGPSRLRQAALEGLCRGLGAWPLRPLRQTLVGLAADLHAPLAASAVDALARLPGARPSLRALARQPLDPAVAARLERRVRGLPPAPLVLLIHGRAGGEVPPELLALAMELGERRGAPVLLETLTAAPPPPPSPSATPHTVVPRFLLPGGHVRSDVPERLRRWRAAGAVRALPFLGAWPAWQASLAIEVRRLAARGSDAIPLLVHHPVEGLLPQRYLAHLSSFCGARCLAFASSSALSPALAEPALPLALASSRLTDAQGTWLGPPLLARPKLRAVLLQLLEDLP